MRDVVDRLESARSVAWASLRPAFDHAISLAREAEHEAERAANIAMTHVIPAYPPLVLRLAESSPIQGGSADPDMHRGRSWGGPGPLEESCPCVKAACGLVAQVAPECTEHPDERGKTMRSVHLASLCPVTPKEPSDA